MCCTTTIGIGKRAGSRSRIRWTAGGPPVEAPITQRSQSRSSAAVTAVRRWTRRGVGAVGRAPIGVAGISACIRSTTSRRRNSRSITLKALLSMKSTAPAASAETVAVAPSFVCADSITTRSVGFQRSSAGSTLSPSIPGMSTSRVTKSGSAAGTLASASAPDSAVSHDLEPRLGREHPGQRPPHERRVVHHEDADHAGGFR